MFCCDTKAHEKVLCVQGPNSESGCYYCMDFKGTRLERGEKMVYYDHRRFLPINHPMRKIKIKQS